MTTFWNAPLTAWTSPWEPTSGERPKPPATLLCIFVQGQYLTGPQDKPDKIVSAWGPWQTYNIGSCLELLARRMEVVPVGSEAHPKLQKAQTNPMRSHPGIMEPTTDP